MAPPERVGIKFQGDNEWITLIQNASEPRSIAENVENPFNSKANSVT